MTAGNDGTPENDDPFAYLYRGENGGAEQQPDPGMPQPGRPRTSHHQVQRVGERRTQQYPQQQPPQAPGGYGYPPQQQPPQAPGGYGYPPQQAQPQAPLAGPWSDEPDPPNRKGLLIGAIAVVAAVAIGIAFAMTNSSGDKGNKADNKATTQAPTSAPQTTQSSPSASATPFASQKIDASTLTLAGGAKQSTQWTGANAAGGTYVDGMNAPGASVLWTVTVPKDDTYTFHISYGNAGDDANLGLAVNGKPRTDLVNLRNYGHYTDWSKAWNNTTYSYVDLKAGANTLSLTCLPTKNCGVNLDQLWLTEGKATK